MARVQFTRRGGYSTSSLMIRECSQSLANTKMPKFSRLDFISSLHVISIILLPSITGSIMFISTTSPRAILLWISKCRVRLIKPVYLVNAYRYLHISRIQCRSFHVSSHLSSSWFTRSLVNRNPSFVLFIYSYSKCVV